MHSLHVTSGVGIGTTLVACFFALAFASFNSHGGGINLAAFEIFEENRNEVLSAESVIELSDLAMFKLTVSTPADDNVSPTREKADQMLVILRDYAQRVCKYRGQHLSTSRPIDFREVPFQQIYLKRDAGVQVFVLSTDKALLDQSLGSACEDTAQI